MKLLEKVLYASLLFLFIYVVLSLTLRLFEITTVYNSHMIGGIIATLFSMGLFMFLLLKNNKQ